MGKRKKLLLKIEDKRKFIEDHQDKINDERRKPNPDEGLIRHWQSEIKGQEDPSLVTSADSKR